MRALVLFPILLGLIASSPASAEIPSELKALVAAAEKEGTLDLVWSESLLGGPDVVKQHQTVMNAQFGTHLTIAYTPGPEMARLGNQLLTEMKGGQKASSDVYVASAVQIQPLLGLNLFQPVSWSGLMPDRIPAAAAEAGGRALRIGTALTGATYNTDLYKPTGTETLQDLLKPEWKGKLATTPYAAGFDVLAAKDWWGADKVLDYLGKLTHQVQGFIRCGEDERIASSEYVAFALDCVSSDAILWHDRGAPVGFFIPTDSAQIRYYYVTIPAHAVHPAAAALFGLHLSTKEGQELAWEAKRMDMHLYPESKMRAMIGDAQSRGADFHEITNQWVADHPEVDPARNEMVKLLSQAK
jgi:ABC-type Fe3+ transport system substrate-binding protein